MKVAIFWTEQGQTIFKDEKDSKGSWDAKNLSEAYILMQENGFSHARSLDLDAPKLLNDCHQIPQGSSSI